MSTASQTEQTEKELTQLSSDWHQHFPGIIRSSRDISAFDHTSANMESAESKFGLYAVIPSDGGKSSGVVSFGDFNLSQFYYGSDSLAVAFNQQLEDIAGTLMQASREKLDSVQLNVIASTVWVKIKELKEYLGRISDEHDEVITSLFTVCMEHRAYPVNLHEMSSLAAALQTLRNKVRFNETSLNAFEDTLEAAGFSLRFATQNG